MRQWPWIVGSLGAALVVWFVWFGLVAPSIWRECRAAGHSQLYCSRLVVR
jgi:hypothetical protein